MDCGLASGSGNLKVSVNKREGTIGEKTEDVNEGGVHSWNKIPQGLCNRGKVSLRKAIPVYPYIVEREGFGIYYNILVRAQVKLISIN